MPVMKFNIVTGALQKYLTLLGLLILKKLLPLCHSDLVKIIHSLTFLYQGS